MPRSLLKRWIALTVAASPAAAIAQVGLPIGESPQEQGATNEVGGRASMDLIRLDGTRFSFPLRYANLKKGSEQIEMDGRVLRRSLDYSIDYKAGVVYMLRPFKQGQSLRVNYRYLDDKSSKVGTFGASQADGTGYQGLALEFSPNTSFFLGLGMTERLSDGTVLSSNVYGVSNSFSSSLGKVEGIFMVGERMRSNGVSLFGDYGNGRKQTDEGQGTAIVQQMTSNALGGKFTLGYQDIDKQFAGFASMKQNGRDDAEVNAFKKERGLKRSSFGYDGLNSAGNGMLSSFNTVGDDTGSINWRKYAASFSGLTFSWDAQKVDKGFKRYNDIREADRAQLKKESGLDRQMYSIGYTLGTSNLSYNLFDLENEEGTGMQKRTIALTTPGLTLNFSDQSIDKTFRQFAGLRKKYNDQNSFNVNQLKKESGISRNSFGASTDKMGGALSYNTSTVEEGDAGITAEDFTFKGEKWDIGYVRRDIDAEFTRMNVLSPAESQAHINSIVGMYAPGAKANGNDKKVFSRSPGLKRELWRMGYDFGSGYKVSADRLTVDGASDGLFSQAYTLNGPNVNFSMRSTDVGMGFDEISQLMPTEQNTVGVNAGLSKTDMLFSTKINALSTISFSQMNAGIDGIGALRQTLGYSTKGLDVKWSRRSVDDEFNQVRLLKDKEARYLTSLIGFDQTNLSAKWSVMPGLNLNLNWTDAGGITNEEEKYWRDSRVQWALDSNTSLSAFRSEQKFDDDYMSSIDRSFDQVLLKRDLGRLGILSLLQEERQYDGEDDTQPDSKTQRLVYETSLTKNTSLQTSHGQTNFEDGGRETSMSNTLSQKFSERFGVSFTDSRTTRDGDKPDTGKRDYGLWYDFGNNLKFTYGYKRDLKGTDAGVMNKSMSLSAGQFQGINVKSLKYQNDNWNDTRDKHTGLVDISTVKPMQFGSFRDVELFYTADTLHDASKWKKENRTMGLTGNISGISLGYGYRSETLPSGDRAIDRVMSLNTDSSGKAAIRAEMSYDLRTMPNNQEVAIRDYKFTAKFSDDWSVENKILTNPLQNGKKYGKFLGFVAKDTRVNTWAINYTGSKSMKGKIFFDERQFDRTQKLLRDFGVNVTLFADNASPLSLTYLTNLTDDRGKRMSQHRFQLSFMQQPGPNQSLNFSIGNINWQYARPGNKPLQDWSMRVDYGLRF